MHQLATPPNLVEDGISQVTMDILSFNILLSIDMFSHCVLFNALEHYINKCVKIDFFPSQIVNDKVELFAVLDAIHDAA